MRAFHKLELVTHHPYPEITAPLRNKDDDDGTSHSAHGYTLATLHGVWSYLPGHSSQSRLLRNSPKDKTRNGWRLSLDRQAFQKTRWRNHELDCVWSAITSTTEDRTNVTGVFPTLFLSLNVSCSELVVHWLHSLFVLLSRMPQRGG